MSNPRYPEEFKIQAVNQVIEKKLPVADVAARLGVSTHSLYAWIKRYSKPQEERQQEMISTLNYVVCERSSSASLKSETS